MNNQDDYENMNNSDSTGKTGPSDDEIPMWLQGFEDVEPDDTKPVSIEEQQDSDELPSYSETSSIDSESETEPDSPLTFEEELEVENGPDRELSWKDDHEGLPLNEEQEIENKTGMAFFDDQDEEMLGNEDPMVEDLPEPIELIDEELSSPEGFLDISELASEDKPEGEEIFLDNEPIRQGELPEWLQEMINESDELQPEFDELEEPEAPELGVEPYEISLEETIHATDPDHFADTLKDETQLDDEEPEYEHEFDADFLVIDEDTSPVPVSLIDQPEPALPPEKEPISNDTFVEESLEDYLTLIKQKLEQEEYKDALPLINRMINEETELKDLKFLLGITAERDTGTPSQIFEALGDVALKQNKPDDALQAYAKAIRHLVINDEAYDEVG